MTKECTDSVLRAISSCLKSPQTKAKVFEALMRYECTGEEPPDLGKWRNAKAVFTCCVEIITLHEKIAQSQKDNKRKAGIMSGEARQKKEANEGEESVVSNDVTTYEQNPTETNRNFEPATHTNNSNINNTGNINVENTRAKVEDVWIYICNKLVEFKATDPPGTPETDRISNVIWKWCNYISERRKSPVTTYFAESVIMMLRSWYRDDFECWKASIYYHIQTGKTALYYQNKSMLMQYGKQGQESRGNYFDKQQAESDAAKQRTLENIARISADVIGGSESGIGKNPTTNPGAICDGS